jgi:hypothetical protein
VVDLTAWLSEIAKLIQTSIAVATGVLTAIGVFRRWVKKTLGITEIEMRSLENLMYNASAPMTHRIASAHSYLDKDYQNPLVTPYAKKLIADHEETIVVKRSEV